jgi:hypothetical protein
MTGLYVVRLENDQSSLRKHWPPLKKELESLLQSEEFATEPEECN